MLWHFICSFISFVLFFLAALFLVLLAFGWLHRMVITLCYDAVSRNVQGLGISPFVMFTLSATSILPACLLLIALQDRIGRKAMASMSLLLSGIFISCTGIILFEIGESSSEQSKGVHKIVSKDCL